MTTTTFASALQTLTARHPRDRRAAYFGLLLPTALTPLAVIIGGYHPYSEDGGLYLAGIKQSVDPSLFQHGTEFVAGHLPFSLFIPAMTTVLRVTRLPLPWVLLAAHLVACWLTLCAASMLASRCFTAPAARAGAVGLLALWLTLPIAGTSLMLMDPNLTARSFSTPCALFALAGTLQLSLSESPGARRCGLALCLFSLLAACAMHMLMGIYAIEAVLLLLCTLAPRPAGRLSRTGLLSGLAIAAAAAIQLIAPPESSSYVSSALTRSYWFLGSWTWYEQFGLIAPLLVSFSLTGLRRFTDRRNAFASLARMCLAGGLTSITSALLFARPSLASHLLARLQPLRIFQLIYIVMILGLGAFLGRRLLKRSALRWISATLLLGGIMLYAQRQIYPASLHLELPGLPPANSWVQAFLWISRSTPRNALFAIDANYIGIPGEDAQTFRAIAERSVLPDYAKDGGEAAISPALSAAWIRGVAAQTSLGTQTDAQRLHLLVPLGVTWIVLQRFNPTRLDCPYTNPAVKVCRLLPN